MSVTAINDEKLQKHRKMSFDSTIKTSHEKSSDCLKFFRVPKFGRSTPKFQWKSAKTRDYAHLQNSAENEKNKV